MESAPNLRQSMSASRISSVDVSQLDKINAIPNKTTNNVLLDGLCQEDQLYLDAMMDEESMADSDEDARIGLGGSVWSPAMAERPMMNNKRIKRMKPSYTITMSLEDISYIRPSWGMSKGIVKKIDMKKGAKGKGGGEGKQRLKFIDEKKTTQEVGNRKILEDDDEQVAPTAQKLNPIFNTYNTSLAVLMFILSFLMILSYYVDLARQQDKTLKLGLEFYPQERMFEILKFKDGQLTASQNLRVHYGRGIASNLKPIECSCQMYHAETRKHNKHLDHLIPNQDDDGDQEKCFACFDWAMRANLQVLVNISIDGSQNDEHSAGGTDSLSPSSIPNLETTIQPTVPLDEDLTLTCYDVRWQSYDTLRTPLVDCIRLNEGDQWFGLGDIQTSPPTWPLNKINQAVDDLTTTLMSNLSGEFNFSPDFGASNSQPDTEGRPQLILGSQVEFKLLSSNGFYVGNLRSDFQPTLRISAERRELCLSVGCTDRCTPTWSRLDHLQGKFSHRNNLLEYSICSASSWRVLVSRLINQRQMRGEARRRQLSQPSNSLSVRPKEQAAFSTSDRRSDIERIESPTTGEGGEAPSQLAPLVIGQAAAMAPPVATTNGSSSGSQPSAQPQPQLAPKRQIVGIGLIERTIFTTSLEYLPTLDGQTLRQHVDKIVRLNLRTSPILVIDTRWQPYSGSFRINLDLFPKAKLLFEILHNKGFKIVLALKPYIDTSIGMANLNQLLDNQR